MIKLVMIKFVAGILKIDLTRNNLITQSQGGAGYVDQLDCHER